MSGFFDHLTTSGIDHALLAAQQGEYSVMNLAVDLGASRQDDGGVVWIVQWMFTIFAAITCLNFFWKSAAEWGSDTKKALVFFTGGVILPVLLLLLSVLFPLLSKGLGVTEQSAVTEEAMDEKIAERRPMLIGAADMCDAFAAAYPDALNEVKETAKR